MGTLSPHVIFPVPHFHPTHSPSGRHFHSPLSWMHCRSSSTSFRLSLFYFYFYYDVIQSHHLSSYFPWRHFQFIISLSDEELVLWIHRSVLPHLTLNKLFQTLLLKTESIGDLGYRAFKNTKCKGTFQSVRATVGSGAEVSRKYKICGSHN